ncbi:MAG: SGNH/GDSL hydrolase family protein [Myxococcota bacterium]
MAVVLGILIPFGIVEGLAAIALSIEKRNYKPQMPAEVEAAINEDDRHIPTLPDPFLTYRVQPEIQRERVQTNALGLREGPISTTPAPGTTRILFLGGSVAWGYTANSNDDTISSYLEAALEQRAASDPALAGQRFEVLNGGVPAYVSWQEALAYALERRTLGADWVVTLDGTNDVASAIINSRAGVPMRFRATEAAYLAAQPTLRQALRHWFWSGVGDLRVVKAFERLRPKPLEAYDAPAPTAIADSLAASLRYLSDAAEAEQARVLTVLQPMVILPDTKPLAPFEEQIVVAHDRKMPGRNAYYAETFAVFRETLTALSSERAPVFAWLDATDVYRETPEITYTDHCHLTPTGRRVLADAIADRLILAFSSGS